MGTTVICAGNSPGGFAAAPGVNGLSVNVEPGANVGTGITLNDNNVVSNLGTVSVGDFGTGIEVNNGGSISNRGLISVGDSGVGIMATGDNVRIANNGLIGFGDCGAGIVANGTGNSVVNTGSLIGIGCGNVGIQVGDSGSVSNSGLIRVGDTGGGIVGGVGTNVVNSGLVIAGADGFGIFTGGNITNSGLIIVGDTFGFGGGLIADGNNLRVANSGTILGGMGTPGIVIMGNDGMLNNSGTIIVGDYGGGLVGMGNRHTYLNSGLISVGADGIGISVQGNNSTVNNSGTINFGPCGTGIDSSNGFGNSITNSGRISGNGCGATGVELGASNTLTNSGLIQGSALGYSVRASGGNNTVFNSGTLDGPVSLLGSGNNTLTNDGLITVSAPLAQGLGVYHAVTGTFTQNASGTLALRVGPNAAATNYDSLTVFGSANLGGTLRARVQPGLYGSTVIYQDAVSFTNSTGSFASVEASTIFFNASAIYNPGSVDLILNRIPFNQVPGGGANARAVGYALEASYSTNLTGTAAAFYSQLLQSSATNTLSQLTGEIATTGQNASFGVFNQFFGTIFGQLGAGRSSGSAQSADAGKRISVEMAEACTGDICQAAPASSRRMTYWAQGFGASGSYDSNANVGSSRIDVTSGGGATGIDGYVTPDLRLGVTLGTTGAGYALTDLASTGTAQSIVFGAYGSLTAGPAYVDAVAAYAYGSFTTQRYISTGALSEQVNGAFNGNQYGGRIEGGWRFAFDQHAITPFGNFTVQALQQNGYSEVARDTATGAPGLTGLNVQAQTTTSVRSVLGAEFTTSFGADDGAIFRPRLRIGWAHEFSPYRTSTATFAALGPGVPFTIQGAQPATDALLVTAGLSVDLGRMVRVYAQFDGDFAGIARSFAGTGGVRLIW